MERSLKDRAPYWLLVLGIGLAPATQAADCTSDGEAYLRAADSAVSIGALSEATNYVQNATEQGCDGTLYRIGLGEALSRRGAFADAATQFNLAQKSAANSDDQAIAIGRYAEALAEQVGMNSDSLDLIHFARRQHSDPPEWMSAFALKLDTALIDQPFSSERVTRSFSSEDTGRLTMGTLKALPRLGADPLDTELDPTGSGSARTVKNLESLANRQDATGLSIAFRVYFQRGQAELDPRDSAKVEELAAALSDKSLNGRRFRLFGHTDITGSWEVNQQLSERRAETVYRRLVSIKPELAARLTYAGRGSSELLYPDAQGVLQHRLNRRVQIVLE